MDRMRKVRAFSAIVCGLLAVGLLAVGAHVSQAAGKPASGAVGVHFSTVTSVTVKGKTKAIKSESWIKFPNKLKMVTDEMIMVADGKTVTKYDRTTKKSTKENKAFLPRGIEKQFDASTQIAEAKKAGGVVVTPRKEAALFPRDNYTVMALLVKKKASNTEMHLTFYYDKKTDRMYGAVMEGIGKEMSQKTVTKYDYPAQMPDSLFVVK